MTQAGNDKLRLMVVDDESDNLDLLFRTFRRNFRVFKAESAMEAIRLLQEEGEVGIIISDQRMPRMTGTEFLSRVAEEYPDTIRILLTGYTDVEDLVDAINSGKVFKYVTKPWNPEDLQQVVQQAAETYRAVKHRTVALNRALRRESIFNGVMTAIRESLDYTSMLQTIVETVGHIFSAHVCGLHPLVEQTNADGSLTYQARPASHVYRAAAIAEEATDVMASGLNVVDKEWGDRPTLVPPSDDCPYARLLVPLIYQKQPLALLVLHRHPDQENWTPDDLEVLEAVSSQVALAMFQAKLYQRIQKQSEQMQAELAVARQIQTNLLRQEWPKLDQVRIQACCHPAREVGGDFFEVYVHPRGDVWICVGDVSGKGVPAALFMASAITVLRRELSQDSPPDPNDVMQNLNSSLIDDLVSNNCFITMVLARYSPQTQELVYANAGHIYPLSWQQAKDGTGASVSEPHYHKVRGVPLGILPTWKAEAGKLTLQPGEMFVLASDGITEAVVAADDQSGRQMLQQEGLWQIFSSTPGAIQLTDVLQWIQSRTRSQEDDQTILSLEVLHSHEN